MRRLSLLLLLSCGIAVTSAHAADSGRNFVVFFREWSAAIDGPAQAVVRHAAEWVKEHPSSKVVVTGAADLTGSKPANQLLSELRAQVVTDLLATDGVNPDLVKQVGLGSVDYALTSQESRRVIITVTEP